MSAFLAVLSILSLLSLGFVTIVNNPRLKSNLYFFCFCAALALWVLANYLADADAVRSLFWTRLTFLSIVGAVMSFRLFVGVFPRRAKKLAVNTGLLALTGLAMAVVIFTRYFIPHVKFVNGTSTVVPGGLYPLFVVYFVVLAGISIFGLVYQYRNLEGLDRNRVRLILEGLLIVVIAGSVFNLFLPLAVGNNRFAPIGTYSTVIFAVSIYLAIFRHRLFDIRAAVARSVAYILLLAWLAAVYTAGLFGVIDVIFSGTKHVLLRQYLSIGLILPLVLTFPYLKRFFDHITNKIFYRDNYDTQTVLDQLGHLLVAEINLDKILTGSRAVLMDAIKCTSLDFVLLAKGKPYLASPGGRKLADELAPLANHLRAARADVVISDALAPQGEAYKLLNEAGVAVSLRLQTSQQRVGYILFGPKRSGNIYGSQDRQLLTIAANELAVAIQNALRFQEIQRFNVTLQEKIDEATRELRRANARLRELDKTKDEFISMASHQLRTPLTTVKGYLSMVLEGDMGAVKKPQKEVLQNAFDGANRMVYLIADLLNVSRLQSGKFVIDNKPTDLAAVVEGEVTQLRPQAANRQIQLTYQKPEHFPVLNLDETKIRQVIMNFLDNAIFYTPKGGKVTASLIATDKEVSYTVTDTGVGVPKEVQHHLFSKFYRADNARKMRPDGTGLGLYMAKKVVAAQGGAIIFKSAEGKGSVFGFSFPRKPLELKGAKAVLTDTAKGPELPPSLTPAKKS